MRHLHRLSFIQPARVPRQMVRALRAAIHKREQGQLGKGETLSQLRGWAAYIYMTDPQKGQTFFDQLNALAAKPLTGTAESEESRE